jgi:hypothetical protein
MTMTPSMSRSARLIANAIIYYDSAIWTRSWRSWNWGDGIFGGSGLDPQNSAEHVVKFMERHLVGDRDQADDHRTHLAQNRSQNQALSSTTLEAGMLADRPCKWDLSIIDFNTKALASYPIG